jgi:hypothetical protein
MKKAIIVLLVFGLIALIITVQNNAKKKELNENNVESVCYVDTIITRRSFRRINFHYFYNGQRIKDFQEIDKNPRRYIGKYYKIILSRKNPYNSEVLLDEEIHDIVKIKDAGF